MTEHTKEPWRVAYRGAEGAYDIDARSGSSWGDVSLALNVNEADARRIVACVNACRGIRTEALEHRVHALEAEDDTISVLTAQRDQLLAAAVDAYELLKVIHDETGKVGSKLHAAIAAVKGD